MDKLWVKNMVYDRWNDTYLFNFGGGAVLFSSVIKKLNQSEDAFYVPFFSWMDNSKKAWRVSFSVLEEIQDDFVGLIERAKEEKTGAEELARENHPHAEVKRNHIRSAIRDSELRHRRKTTYPVFVFDRTSFE